MKKQPDPSLHNLLGPICLNILGKYGTINP